MKQEESQPSGVGARMDAMPVTRLHLAATALCLVGFAFELFELSLGSVLAAVFSHPARGVSTAQLSWLLASVYIGAIVGAPVLGWLADRIGRRRVLAGALGWLALSSVWAAYSPDVVQLTCARVLAGVAVGAYPPLMMAYLTDLLPSGRRGPIILWAFGLAGLGLPASVFLVRELGAATPLGLEGWRFALLLGAVGAGVLGLVMLRLPESPRWLQAKGRDEEAERACRRFAGSATVLAARAVAPPAPAPREGGSAPASSASGTSPWSRLAPLFLLSPIATVTFPLLMGSVLTLRGFKLSDALLFVGLSTFGPTLGSLAAAGVVDRVERRLGLCVCAGLLLLSGGLFVVADSRFLLGLSAIVFGIGSILYVTSINLYAAELFPTPSRAGLSALAWSFNRVGAAASVLALVPLLKEQGPVTLFLVIAASLVLSMALLIASPRGLQRQAIA